MSRQIPSGVDPASDSGLEDLLRAVHAGNPIFKYASAEECPDSRHHTKHPVGYVAHAEWMERKAKTCDQRRCVTCGYWVIWVPRRRRSKAVSA